MYPQVTKIQCADGRELVFFREVSSTTSIFQCLWFAWDEAQLEAELAYAAWRREHGAEAYLVYRAAQDRADAAQDALARCAGEPESASVDSDMSHPAGGDRRPAGGGLA